MSGSAPAPPRPRKTDTRRPDLDTMYTINPDGSRNFLHPADVHGRWQSRKNFLWGILLAIYIGTPWILIGGRPAVHLDIPGRNAFVLGHTFTNQDFYLMFFLVSGLGFALFLSTLHVFLRDTLQVVTVLTTVWMFVTPIFWAPEALGESVAKYKPMLGLNPVYHLVQAWRGVLMGDLEVARYVAEDGVVTAVGGYVSSVDAISGHATLFGVGALIVFAVGFSFFVLCQRRFADEV